VSKARSVRRPEDEVELGEEVEARRERPSGPVVAVRMPREVLAKLSEYAAVRNTTISEVVRQAAIRLAGELDAGPFYTSGVHLEGPKIVSGSPTRGGQIRSLEYEYDSDLAVTKPGP
jgi:hypothetical protein